MGYAGSSPAPSISRALLILQPHFGPVAGPLCTRQVRVDDHLVRPEAIGVSHYRRPGSQVKLDTSLQCVRV